jgi:hypothetical protein
MVDITSYPDLTRAIINRLKNVNARREAKKYGISYIYGRLYASRREREAYAKAMGWNYRPPVPNYDPKVTDYETKNTPSGTISVEQARKPNQGIEPKYKPQTQKTIEQLKTGEIKTKEDIYMVGGEVALSKKTAEAVAIYKQQQREEQQEKQKKKFYEKVKKDTQERFMKDWEVKKAEIKETKPTEVYFIPERKKSAQETIDKTTNMDWKQFVKFSDTIPKKEEPIKETITKQQLIESRQEGFIQTWGTFLDYREQELLKKGNIKTKETSKAINEIISLSASTETIRPTEFKTNIDTQTKIIDKNKLTIQDTSRALLVPAYFGVARGTKNVVYSLRHPIETIKNIPQIPFYYVDFVQKRQWIIKKIIIELCIQIDFSF